MLTADEFAIQLVHVLRQWGSLFSAEQKDYYNIQSVESNGNRVRVIATDTPHGAGDKWEFEVMCSGATMVQPEDASPPEPELESKESEESIVETQPQGVGERIDRKVRPPKVTPTTKKPTEKTPRRPANNDPTKTPRGKAALKKQIKKNKAHPEKFEGKSPFLDKALMVERDDVISLVDKIDPIAESKIIRSLMEHGDSDGKLVQIDEVIHNVWSTRYIEKHIGVAKSRSDELKVFSDAGSVLDEFKNWGAQVCWIERIRKPGFAIYKVCADAIPSKVYMEHRADSSRDLILSTDHANIIPKIFGDL